MPDGTSGSGRFTESIGSVDTFTEVTTTGWGRRIVNSIVGVLFGILLFFGSFVLLFWNEGRGDTSDLARGAAELSPADLNPGLNGKLVSLTGVLESDEMLGDGQFLMPGKYIAIHRTVDMFAWVEESRAETRGNVGGSETRETTYTYERRWVNSPARSSSFRLPQGHTNPEKALADATTRARAAKIGAYNLDMSGLDLGGLTRLALSPDNTTLAQGARLAGSEYVFVGRGTLQAPEVGDLRVSYAVLDAGAGMTVFGRRNGDTIAAYAEGGERLFRVFPGTREQAIGTLHSEYVITTWVLRLVGFVMMWGGLGLLFGPISTLADILPFLGGISRFVFGLVTLFVSLVLSITTIVISAILHNILALVIVLALLVASAVFLARSRKSRRQAPGIAAG